MISRVLAAATLVLGIAHGQTIDGDLSDWNASLRVLPAFYQESDISTYTELYSQYKSDEDAWYFMLKPQQSTSAPYLRTGYIMLDTDLSRNTTYTPLSNDTNTYPTGIDAYIYVATDYSTIPLLSIAALYTGCLNVAEGCATKIADLDAVMITYGPESDPLNSTDAGVIELKLPLANLTAASIPVDSSGDLNVAISYSSASASGDVYISSNSPLYLLNFQPVYKNFLAQADCAYDQNHVAVLFSLDTQTNFFQDKAYRQLFLSAQGQIMQTGLAYDRITLTDLLDVSSSCRYKAVVIPYMAWVEEDELFAIRKALVTLVHYYKVSIVTVGDFATNTVSTKDPVAGDPYFTMPMVLGIRNDDPVYAQTNKTYVYVADNELSIFRDKTVGELLMDESNAGTYCNMYIADPLTSMNVTVVSTQYLEMVDGTTGTFNAIIATRWDNNIFGKVSGRSVHFSTLELAFNRDLIWRALEWATIPDGLTVGVQLSRQDLLFAMRTDMDQSQYEDQAIIIEPGLLDRIIKPWYGNYSFVGSFYINLGNDTDEYEYTDWTIMQPLYQEYIDYFSEIGTHSFTHPENINLLSDYDLWYEFELAKQYTMGNMSLSRLAAAQPGATEDLDTLLKLEPYFNTTYFSGGYAGVGAGYPGCYGYIDTESEMVYIAPNMYFDFTGIEFLKWTSDELKAFWFEQIANQTENAKLAIMHFPVHDYGLTDWNDDSLTFDTGMYPTDLIEPVIAKAYNMNAEFVTGMELNDRIRTFRHLSVAVTDLGSNNYSASVTSSGSMLGTMALSAIQDGTQVFSAVENWPAFTSERIFLPRNGGTFVFTMSDTNSTSLPARVTKLAQRMVLESVSASTTSDVTFTVTGVGAVEVTLPSGLGSTSVYSGADSATVSGDVYTLNFATNGTHTCTVGPSSSDTTGKSAVLATEAPTPMPTAPTPSPTPQPTCNE